LRAPGGVVDDDEAVLETAKETVADLGYRVMSAHNGREALQILKGFGQIDLLFSDIVMTGKINGIQLAAHRREQLAANLREFIDRKAAEKLPYWDVLQKTRKGE